MKTEQTNTPDPQLRKQLDAKSKKFDEAFNNNEATVVTAFFTEDGVLVTDRGLVYGREAIEKSYADLFKEWRASKHIGKRDQYSPHVLGMAGNEIWQNGEWSLTLQGQTGDPIPVKGYWSEILIRDGDAWKVRMQTWNIPPHRLRLLRRSRRERRAFCALVEGFNPVGLWVQK